MNLYEVLGVEQDATDADIKRAYRKLAQKLHPDRDGGDAAKFTEVQAAYTILSDESERAEYDRTGTVAEDSLDYEASATQTLRNLFNLAISSGVNSVHQYCLSQLFGSLRMMREQRAQEQNLHALLTKYRNRVIRKNKGPNIFSEVLEERLLAVSQSIKGMDKGIKITEMAREMLNDYEHNSAAINVEEPTPRLKGGFATVKMMVVLVILAAATLFSGAGQAADYSYYVKIGAGYKFDEPTKEVRIIDGVRYEGTRDYGSDLSSRIEIGIEKGSVTFGLSHHSQWLDGWPRNDSPEYYKTELFVDYKFTFGG